MSLESPSTTDAILATTAKLLAAVGHDEASAVLKKATASLEHTGRDNWNGGTDLYTLWLRLSADAFAALSSTREALETQIAEQIRPLIEQVAEAWIAVKIAPLLEVDPDWRASPRALPRATRQSALDAFALRSLRWSGDLEEVEFLERLYDLRGMPSGDPRHKDAAGDIWRHRVANPTDWPDNWIFSDKRFQLLDGPDEPFLEFLCESLHPAVRKSRQETTALLADFNAALSPRGWKLSESEPIAGHPRFIPMRVSPATGHVISRARTVADALDAGWMAKEIRRMEDAIDSDPALAIGTAKDLVESCCKTILTRRGIAVSASTKMPDLVHKIASELGLVPSAISEEARGAKLIKVLLSNLSQIPLGLAELRSLYGSGHGRAGNYKGLEPRHARLAVGAAVAFIDFVTATDKARS